MHGLSTIKTDRRLLCSPESCSLKQPADHKPGLWLPGEAGGFGFVSLADGDLSSRTLQSQKTNGKALLPLPEQGGRKAETWGKGRGLLAEIKCPHSVHKNKCSVSPHPHPHPGSAEWRGGGAVSAREPVLALSPWADHICSQSPLENGVSALQGCYEALGEITCERKMKKHFPVILRACGHISISPE